MELEYFYISGENLVSLELKEWFLHIALAWEVMVVEPLKFLAVYKIALGLNIETRFLQWL